MQLLRSEETYEGTAHIAAARWLRCNGAESLRGECFPRRTLGSENEDSQLEYSEQPPETEWRGANTRHPTCLKLGSASVISSI